MDVSLIISVYGAVLATSLAAGKAIGRYLDNPRIKLEGALTSIPHEYEVGDMVHRPRGTIVAMHVIDPGPNGLLEMQEVLVELTVRNHGRRAIQLVSVTIEGIEDDVSTVYEITPDPLPYVLDPLVSVEITFQKEVIDFYKGVAFIGVTDARGRRHGLNSRAAKNLIEESWGLPTRVQAVKHRDTGQRANSFQATDSMRFQIRRPRRLPRAIATRTSEGPHIPGPKVPEPDEPYLPSEENPDSRPVDPTQQP
jgi:hypothetical protein